MGDWNGYGQAAYVYQDSSVPLLFPAFYNNGPAGQQHLGELPPYSLVNLATGVDRNNTKIQVRLENAFNSQGELTRFAACTPTTTATSPTSVRYSRGRCGCSSGKNSSADGGSSRGRRTLLRRQRLGQRAPFNH